jgi:hypothetical protein
LNLGLQTVDIEVFGISVAFLAGRDIRLKGVVVTFAQVASHEGVFHHCGVRAGAAFDLPGASKAKQHGTLGTMMGTPVGAGDLQGCSFT